ncbi:hypothetical protein [Streptomyces decoyicus]
MATLPSIAINLLRPAGGHTNLAAALREMPYEPFSRPLDLPDLVCPGQACTSQWIK